jgi:arsenical pump membrane protein
VALRNWRLVLAGAGAAASVGSAAADPEAAGSAAGQTWPAFVLVAGLLLVGLVAFEDGLFEYAGERLARAAERRFLLYIGVTVLVAVVTAVLNLDTSVAFLAPVLVHTARRRGEHEAGLLAMCILLSNAGSLVLPGSNLTNLIVAGHRTGGSVFASRMVLPWVVAVAVTAVVAAVVTGRHRDGLVPVSESDRRPHPGAGLLAVAAVVAAVLTLGNPAPAVAAVGGAVVGWRLLTRKLSAARVMGVLDVEVLVGLFGLAIALGTLGRAWSGPARWLSHLGPWGTAATGAIASVAFNNLPAAALLSARPPHHPLSLLIGLDLGPNLFLTGSLAWVLWFGASRAAGGEPDVGRTVRAGLVAAPLSIAAAVGTLVIASPVH